MADIKISITGVSAEDIKSLADKISIEPEEKEIYYVSNIRDNEKCKEYNNPYEAIVKYEEKHNVLLRKISRVLPEEYICSLKVAYLYTSNKILAKYVEIPNDTFYELEEGIITEEDYPDLFYVRTSTLQDAIEKILTYTGAKEVAEIQSNEDDKEFSYDLIIDLCYGKDLIERKYYNLNETKRYKYYCETNDENKIPIYFDSEEEAVQFAERYFNVILTDVEKLGPCAALPKESLIEIVCYAQIGPEEKKIDSKIFHKSFSSTLTKEMLEKSEDQNDPCEDYFCWNENQLHGFNSGDIIRKFKTEKEAIEYYQRQYNIRLKQTTLTKVLASENRCNYTLLEHHYTTKVRDNKYLETINKTYYEKI